MRRERGEDVSVSTVWCSTDSDAGTIVAELVAGGGQLLYEQGWDE
jgi:hypothetical protein